MLFGESLQLLGQVRILYLRAPRQRLAYGFAVSNRMR